MIAPSQVAALLDGVIYERIVECVDFVRIHALEDELMQIMSDIDDTDVTDKIVETAKGMIDTALGKLASDPRRYFEMAGPGADLDCELCEQEARMHATTAVQRSS